MAKYRSITGEGNNLNTKLTTFNNKSNKIGDVGAAETRLSRLIDPAYENGIDEPRGGDPSFLPSTRKISNTIVNQTESVPNFRKASDWLWQWGQFISHDVSLNEGGRESFAIPVTDRDDPLSPTILLTRVPAAPGSGTGTDNPRQQLNEITSFIDGSNVYGSDEERAKFLRTGEKGQLKTTIGDNGELLLPFNRTDEPFRNANPFRVPDEQLYLAGDVRANEQIGLTAIHALFVREHNRIASILNWRLKAGESLLRNKFRAFKRDYRPENPNATRAEIKDEFLYETTRKVVGAEIQVITYKEFLPLLIGDTLLNDYDGYKPNVNPSINHEFTNAAYRLGHTLLNNQFLRFDAKGITETLLQEAFFKPQDVAAKGINSLLQGLIYQEAQELDHLVVDGLRNFLFPAETGGLDLAAVNIQRGRDVGLPGYVQVREALGLGEIEDFEDLSFDPEVVDLFREAYSSVDEIDLWIGGLAEPPAGHGGLLGQTFTEIVLEQFERLRDGDRFFFLNEDQLKELCILGSCIENTTLADIIRWNTLEDFLVPNNVFVVPFDQKIVGDEGNNSLPSTRGNDLIEGKGGRDLLKGHYGDDILVGGNGSDILIGGNGSDILVGGNGNDKLKGVGESLGAGEIDYLNGGRGHDTFILGDKSAVFYKGGGNDDFAVITDFGRKDRVQLAGDEDDYLLELTDGALPKGTGLYLDRDSSGYLSESDDLIAVIKDQMIADFDRFHLRAIFRK